MSTPEKVFVEFGIPDPGKHIETGSVEYQNYYNETGPHCLLLNHLNAALTDIGTVVETGVDDEPVLGWIVVEGPCETVLVKAVQKALTENNYGLQRIRVVTQNDDETIRGEFWPVNSYSELEGV